MVMDTINVSPKMVQSQDFHWQKELKTDFAIYYFILKPMTFPPLASGKKSDMVKLGCLVIRQNYLTHFNDAG